ALSTLVTVKGAVLTNATVGAEKIRRSDKRARMNERHAHLADDSRGTERTRQDIGHACIARLFNLAAARGTAQKKNRDHRIEDARAAPRGERKRHAAHQLGAVIAEHGGEAFVAEKIDGTARLRHGDDIADARDAEHRPQDLQAARPSADHHDAQISEIRQLRHLHHSPDAKLESRH
ncbi:MAG: hypothetical protein ACXWK2_10425, partial [Rhizomicrobium sp.]